MLDGTSGDKPVSRIGWATVIALLALLAWDAAGLDMLVAHRIGSADGFALRHHWLLENVFHGGGRLLAWGAALGLCLGAWWPVGPLQLLTTGQRVRLAVATLAAALAVSLVKGLSPTSCPWDLQAFGGLARHLSHWQFAPDGGGGHCFPAGHAASGFSFVAGYFAFRSVDRTVAWAWLAAALSAGLLLGGAQQLRGAHFMSHTLWTAWICWCVAWAVHAVPAVPVRENAPA